MMTKIKRKTNRINFKVTDKFKREIQKAAMAKELSVAAWLTWAIQNQLARDSESR
jgi:uncharacterized protein (DUF1778 family)